ncbi:MAG: hypothetical protein AAF598_16860, partial [Bacteroidota bacterium]
KIDAFFNPALKYWATNLSPLQGFRLNSSVLDGICFLSNHLLIRFAINLLLYQKSNIRDQTSNVNLEFWVLTFEM